MEQPLPKKHSFLLINILCLFFIAGFSCHSYAQKVIKKVETDVSFPANLNSSIVDFNLKSTGNKKFKVILDKRWSGSTKVKVYDISGNRIREDRIAAGDVLEKRFVVSHINSQLFGVEVGNSKYNETKSVRARTAGQRRSFVEEVEKESEYKKPRKTGLFD